MSNLWLSSDGWVNVVLAGPTGNKNWWLCQQGASTSVDDGYAPRTGALNPYYVNLGIF